MPAMYQIYQREREKLSEHEIDAILEAGKKWNLAPILQKRGSALFPHTYLSHCGHQIATVVNGCMESGADTVIALGVLHTANDEMRQARNSEKNGSHMASSPYHGITGEGIQGMATWQNEFSLKSFEFLFHEACKRRRGKKPRLITRYPALVGAEPQKLKGIQELAAEAKDAVIVATGDLCHNGAAYIERATILPLGFGKKAEQYAKESIVQGFQLLDSGDYKGYMRHCYTHLNDSMDTLVLLRYLLGPFKTTVHEIKLVDTSGLYEGTPIPSWVAVTLASMEPV